MNKRDMTLASVKLQSDLFEEFKVEVTDGDLFDSQIFTVTVLPINDPPEISTINSQEINEDDIFTINLIADDIDGDQLSYFAESDILDFKATTSKPSASEEDDDALSYFAKLAQE